MANSTSHQLRDLHVFCDALSFSSHVIDICETYNVPLSHSQKLLIRKSLEHILSRFEQDGTVLGYYHLESLMFKDIPLIK